MNLKQQAHVWYSIIPRKAFCQLGRLSSAHLPTLSTELSSHWFALTTIAMRPAYCVRAMAREQEHEESWRAKSCCLAQRRQHPTTSTRRHSVPRRP